jgi:hypothetical protein
MVMAHGMAAGLALALAVLLAAAGAPKLVRPDYVAAALRRVFGPRRIARSTLTAAGRLLGAWELALAAGLLAVRGPASVVVAAAAAVTFAGFLGFVAVAVRRGASCGCWASLTEGPAGGAELARTAVLAGGALTLLALRTAGWTGTGTGAAGFGWAAALLSCTWLAAVAGARVLPVRSAKVARRIAMRSAPTPAGRWLARLAFLAGFVHAGTDAERRRYFRVRDERERAARQSARA